MTVEQRRSLLVGVITGGLFFCAGSIAQTAGRASRIVDRIDESQLVTLKGYSHPSANATNDRGPAAASMELERMHLVLKRSDSQQAALGQLMAEQHTAGTANYHKWLTPDEFGKRFGPSDEDIATIESWLEGHGFSISKVNAGKQTIEFSGNVAQMRAAFHAQIQKYEVNGESHYAAASDPKIPAALAPVVGGFVSLNNFRLKSYAQLLGKATYDRKTDKASPQWTTGGGNSGLSFVLAPEDFAVQYDLNPLYESEIDGRGQTIAIVNESNIDVALVNSFRSLFGLPYNPPEIIIDGNDPGVDGINNPDGGNGASVEAYLDVEWAGAVAPKAQVDLVTGGDTALESGLYLAAEHAVYGNVAPILSMSFGECEATLGSGNQFLSSLYEQAAAQGITVLVSSGDSGSANCDSSGAMYATQGQAVNGLASTPFNVAVGGTDFYYSDYNSNPMEIANQIASYWNETPSNTTPAVSLLGVIPEQPWNNSQYGLNLFNLYTALDELETTIAGGGGGASNSALCSTNTYDTSTNACTGTVSGYPKPAWQSGNGVPSDGVRDLPDVSLFAANGYNYSYYPICYYDGDCQPVASGQTVQISGVGGTSASTPAFAAIMALVDQEYGRQGQAGYVLYPLAAQFPNSFHRVTAGTNSVPCATGSTDCIAVADPAVVDKILLDPSGGTIVEGQIGSGTTASYNAGAGYNLATGLGTIDAANLVKSWNKVVLASTSTTLTASQTAFGHGTAINLNGAVTAAGGTPAGDVALMTDSTEQVEQGQTLFTLSNGLYSGSVNYLPGGTYNIWGQYGGNAANGMSKSAPVQISVTPEASTTKLTVEDMTDYVYIPSGSTNISYGKMLVLDAQPGPSTNSLKTYSAPTGTVTFADNGSPLATVVLDSIGNAEFTAAWAIGNHSITASYSGDQSYGPSISAASTFSTAMVTPQIGFTWESPAGPPTPGSGNGTNHLDIQVWNVSEPAAGYTAQPTGTVTISSNPAGVAGTGTLIPSNYQGVASFNIEAPPGTYQVTVSYSGDANYNAATELVTKYQQFVIEPPGSGLTSTTMATLTGSISPTTSLTVNGTVTGQNGQAAPTGELFLTDVGIRLWGVLLTPGPGDVSTFSYVLNSQQLDPGKNFLSFQYLGDKVYNGSLFVVSNPVVDPASDFTLVPESSIVPVLAGSDGTETIQLTSVNGFSGAVAFSCTVPSALTCTIASPVTLASAGAATTSVTISAAASTSLGGYNVLIVSTDPTGKYVHTLGLTAVVVSTGFVLTNSGDLTMKAGATTGNTSTVTVTSVSGFSGTVALSCAVTTNIAAPIDLPECALAMSSVSVSSAVSPTVVVTVNTRPGGAGLNQRATILLPSTGTAALALLFMFRISKRRRGWLAMLGLLGVAVSIVSLGCNRIIITSAYGTTPGVYTVTVTGSSGSNSQNTAITATVN